MKALLVALLLLKGAAPVPPDSVADPDLLAGIAMVREGDFEAAAVRLDAAARRLEAQPAQKTELARAFVYLGVAYLELEQELVARGKFRECLLRDRELKLSPREFSPQVIRVFEAERQAIDARSPAPQEAGRTKAAPPAPAQKHSRGKGVYLVIGGGAALAGTALLIGSGGGGEAPAGSSTTTTQPPPSSEATTTTTTSTTMATSTTTTTTSTTEPPSCQYELSPASQNFPATGGTGSCQVRTSRSACGWQAESTETWLQLTGSTSGTGNGGVAFLVLANTGSGRTGRIRLREDREASCEIRQGGLSLGVEPDGGLVSPSIVWTSRLDVQGGRGQVTLNGGQASFHEAGLSRGSAGRVLAENRLEAVLVTARGPGVWQFELGGRTRPGSLRVIAGRVAVVTDTTVAFVFDGSPGERVVFAFRAD